VANAAWFADPATLNGNGNGGPFFGEGPGVSVSVTIDAAMLARLAAIGPADAFGRRCEFSDGTPIPVTTAERLICNGSVTETYTATSPEGIIDIKGITTPARTANRAQRRALAERDRGCAYPGCSAPVDWCDAHHLKPWSAGGRTTLPNLCLLCKFHHHLVHEGGHTLARAPSNGLRGHG
jgi:hypothetical protein